MLSVQYHATKNFFNLAVLVLWVTKYEFFGKNPAADIAVEFCLYKCPLLFATHPVKPAQVEENIRSDVFDLFRSVNIRVPL